MSQKRKIINWSEYNKSLINRGDFTLLISDDIEDNWLECEGSKNTYSNIAIETILTLKALYSLSYRSVLGFFKGLCKVMKKNIKQPNYTTVSRRSHTIKIKLPKIKKNKNIIVAIDSTGLKIFGEGEWKVRQHGCSKRRNWKKLHACVNTETGEILSIKLTYNNTHDSKVLSSLLNDIKEKIDTINLDGAYDTAECYDICKEKKIKNVNIPPRKNAKINQHGNSKKPKLARDETIRKVKKSTLKQWKKTSGYHKRSISENLFFRYKTIFTGKLQSRNDSSQLTEVNIKCKLLNHFTKLGLPISVVA